MALFKYTQSYRHLTVLRTVFCGLLLMLLGIVTFHSSLSLAQESDGKKSYTVEDIVVDVTADNAVEAREKAFEEAQVKGFKMLAERFLSAEEFESYEVPSAKSVASYVNNFEVTNEQLSAVRYKGTYKISYSPRSFAQASNVKKPETPVGDAAVIQKGDLLVIPFYESAGRYSLWQANPYMDAWARARSNQNTGRALVPIGDISDISQIADQEGINYDPSKLNAMRLRYRAKGAVVSVVSAQALTDGSKNIMVSLYRAKAYGPELTKQFSVRALPGEAQDQTYNRVVAEVLRTLKSPAANNNSTTPVVTQQPLSGPTKALTAQLNFTSAREWVETKRAIERARGVASVQVKSLSPRSAVVSVNHQGDVQSLKQSLQQVGVGFNDAVPVGGLYQIYSVRKTSRY